MIEVRQRNGDGVIQFIGNFTEKEFAERYTEEQVREIFSVDPTENTRHTTTIPRENRHWGAWCVTRVTFKHVAYNSRGKILPVDYLVGLVRAYRAWWYYKWTYSYRRKVWVKRDTSPSSSRGRKWHSRGSYYRKMRTMNERRWAHAWDDEEFAPKVRSSRSAKHLPNNWDDHCHARRGNGWKNYRDHQWKEKKGA